jgi:hypothetical protein
MINPSSSVKNMGNDKNTGASSKLGGISTKQQMVTSIIFVLKNICFF